MLRSRDRSRGGRVTASAPFAPTDIAGLQRWYDASDTATITQSGGLVSQWNDKSGNAQHATQTGTNRPTTNTRTINSLNVLDMDGTDDYMIMPAVAPTTGYTVFTVVEMDNFATGNVKAIMGSSNTPGGGFSIRVNNTGIYGIVKVNTSVILNGSTTLAINTPYRLSATTATAGNEVFVDGVSTGSNATNPAYGADLTWIGTSADPLFFFDGKIGEVLIYNRVLNSTERGLVDAYLNAKWFVMAGLFMLWADGSSMLWADGSPMMWS